MALKPSEIQTTFSAFERRLAELHRLFEQYFLGIERRPPVEQRDLLKKEIQRTKAGIGRASTANRFRANSLWQRFVSYDQMWNRTLKQMEDGTYHRDVSRAKRRAQHDAVKTETQSTPTERTSKKKPRAEALADPMIQKIYDTYIVARKRTGESSKVSMGALATQLRERARQMQQKHGSQGVEFKVVIKGGRALIRAQPKKP